jgi:hypothetical protein
MKILFKGSCRKDPSGDDINEDRWAFSESRGTLALCDGASESFDSSVWAQILADKFVLDPAVTSEWVTDVIAEYVSRHDFEAMSWSHLASYQRGTFSTLLGAQYDRERGAADILAIGDSLAVLADGPAIVSCWPFSEPERFKERPTLFSTLPEHNVFISEGCPLAKRVARFDLGTLDTPLLMFVTDAVGEWLLCESKHCGDGLARLLTISSEEELKDLVVSERQASRMRIDDSTLIIVSFDGGQEPNGLPDL